MKTSKKPSLLITAFAFLFSVCSGQTKDTVHPSTIIEAFSSDKDLSLQLIVAKNFSPSSRLGFLGVNYLTGDYKNDKTRNEYESLSFLSASFLKGVFSILGGAMMNHYYGFRPTAGFQCAYGNSDFLAIILPRIDLTETQNFETVGIFEYKPKLKNHWRLYTHVQGLYNYNIEFKSHDRSFFYSRVGVSYKNFSFGLGENMDWYGPLKINENHFGVFVKTEIL